MTPLRLFNKVMNYFLLHPQPYPDKTVIDIIYILYDLRLPIHTAYYIPIVPRCTYNTLVLHMVSQILFKHIYLLTVLMILCMYVYLRTYNMICVVMTRDLYLPGIE